jgi:hypothetical protein
VVDEVTFAELVLDELVGGAGVGHAQQCLGQHHQREALLGRERELPQHVLDPAKIPSEPVVALADRLDQPGRGPVDPGFLRRGEMRRRQQLRSKLGIVRRVGGGKGRRDVRHGVSCG